jgi:hypothetical protein
VGILLYCKSVKSETSSASNRSPHDIKGRYLHEGVASLQEIVHGVKTKNSGEFLKLDFEKANFIRKVLLRKGFEPGWIHRALSLDS